MSVELEQYDEVKNNRQGDSRRNVKVDRVDFSSSGGHNALNKKEDFTWMGKGSIVLNRQQSSLHIGTALRFG